MKLVTWKNQYKIPKNVEIIGLIARLYSDKGLEYFFEAFRLVLKDHPYMYAIIVGEGPLKQKYKKIAADLPIRFLGKVEFKEISYFFHSIHYFLLPSSEHDPFGLAAAEAMAAKRPVIVTDVCGISEFMQNKKHGLVIPAKDSQAIYEAVNQLSMNSDLCKTLEEKGRELAQKEFSLDRMVEEYEKIWS